jgi:pyruvate/2-oxoglutarate dehydrogenase complex dihydrolipoamide dehydrogenase (E3) component
MSWMFTPTGPDDARLIDAVHPPDWTNPTPRGRYDLVVIGAGTGGLVSAAIAAALGARVALVERGLMGGDCLNVGCVPSKALLRAARGWTAARDASERFGGPRVAEGSGDFSVAMARMRRIRADMAAVDAAARFRSLGVDVFLGEGRFAGGDAVAVEGAALAFRRAILATGARPSLPGIPGLDGAGVLTNETLFSLTTLPPRLAVLGGGPIGCEMAQAFARFGSRVTLVERADRVLPREEPEASRAVHRALQADGVDVRLESRVTGVVGAGGGRATRVRLERAGEAEVTVEAERVLAALGRTPNVDVGLDVAGIAVRNGRVQVDSRLRTTNRRVYAVGDVASTRHFTHAADAQARLAVRNALFFGRGRHDELVIPAAVYTSPEIARVGPTLSELTSSGAEVETIRVPFADVDRARLDGSEEGRLMVHLAAGSDRILGATLVAERAGDLLAPLTQALTHGIGLEGLGEVIHPYPTVSAAVGRAADDHRRRTLTPRIERLLGWIVRLTRLLP